MQDSMVAAAAMRAAQMPEHDEQPLRCPRCDSANTKFCYYNNYNLSQPRHFCKSCRRYWTKGGALRNIPVGGGSRKNSKRSSSATDAASPTSAKRATNAAGSSSPTPKPPPSSPPLPPLAKPEPISFLYPLPAEPDRQMLDIAGSFSSLLASSNGQFGNLLDGFHSSEIGVQGLPNSSDFNLSIGTSVAPQPPADFQSSTDSSGNENSVPPMPDNFLGLQGDSGCWSGGWPDLAIYTPGSSFP